MKVMMFLGSATPRIINALNSMSDDTDISTYSSVSSFVQEAELRQLSFNRIIFNKKFVSCGEDDYILLNNFIRNFSSASELVMVIEQGDTQSESLFNKYFSSPMHTCAIVKGSLTMDFFKSLVSCQMVDIKARYYTLDRERNDHVTAKSVGSQSAQSTVSEKLPEDEENLTASAIPAEVPSEVGEFGAGAGRDNRVPQAVEVGSDVCPAQVLGNSANEDFVSTPAFSSEASAPVGGGDSKSDFSSDLFDEDSLALGAFGSAHSDTGVFDDEPEEGSSQVNGAVDAEAQRDRIALLELSNPSTQNREERPARKPFSPPVASITYDDTRKAPTTRKSWASLRNSPYMSNRVNFVLSGSNSLSSQRVIDDAVRMMEDGMRVLLVDFDFAKSSLLSFIDLKNYYSGDHNWFNGGSLYSEEGIDILSGGFGFSPSDLDISKSVSFARTGGYDIVIVDCPVESLSKVPYESLASGNIVVYSGADPCQVTNLALSLSDRRFCSLDKERLAMSSGRFVVEGGVSDLIKETLSQLYFANGSWVS